MQPKDIREALITYYTSYLHIQEGSAEHKALIDFYNGYQPLPRGYKMSYTDSWCAAFISDGIIMMDMDYTVPVECSCYFMMENAKSKGNWRYRDDIDVTQVQEGDIILYNWDNIADPDHVGCIVKKTGTMLQVIEGNHNNAVGYRYIDFNDNSVMGFILPDYDSHPEVTVDNPDLEDDSYYDNIMNWNWDGKGWWYPYGPKKGQFHRNNAIRVNGNLFFFDTEGYAVKNPMVITDEKGALISIMGERVTK